MYHEVIEMETVCWIHSHKDSLTEGICRRTIVAYRRANSLEGSIEFCEGIAYAWDEEVSKILTAKGHPLEKELTKWPENNEYILQEVTTKSGNKTVIELKVVKVNAKNPKRKGKQNEKPRGEVK